MKQTQSRNNFLKHSKRLAVAGLVVAVVGFTGCATSPNGNLFHKVFRSNESLNELPVADAVGIIDYTTEDESNNFRIINNRAYSFNNENHLPEEITPEIKSVGQKNPITIQEINANAVELSNGTMLVKYPARIPAITLKDIISPHLPGVELKEMGNVLMMSGKKEAFNFSDLATILNHYDIAPEQLRVELRIVEYFNDNTYDRELRLKYVKDSIDVININLPSSYDATKRLETGVIINPFFNNIKKPESDSSTAELIKPSNVFEGAIGFLNSHGKTKTLASLDALVSNASPVIFTNQSKIPYPETVITPSAVQEALKYEPTGVVVNLTPYANEQGFINLKIEQAESGEQTGYATTAQRPIFRTAKLQTNCTVREGLTYLVATSLFTRYRSVSRGIPGLDNVPVLKHLSSSRSIETSQSQLLYFITARVLPRDSMIGVQKE